MKSLRDILRYLPENGHIRHAIRQFNLAPAVEGKAKSVKVFAEKLGFSVVRKKLPRGMAGRLVTDPFSENGYCIEVNQAQSIQM